MGEGRVRSPVGYRVPALYMYRPLSLSLPHFTRTPATYSRIFHSAFYTYSVPHSRILPTPDWMPVITAASIYIVVHRIQ